jgi:hypothetical protein
MATTKLKTIQQALDKFDTERVFWLKLSGFIVAILLSSIWQWDYIQSHHLGWFIFTVGTSVSVLWWFWTMKLIRTTLYHRSEEVNVLIGIVEDIKAIKDQVKELKK